MYVLLTSKTSMDVRIEIKQKYYNFISVDTVSEGSSFTFMQTTLFEYITPPLKKCAHAYVDGQAEVPLC